MSQVLFATTRCLTTFGSGPRSFSMSYGSNWTTPMLLLPLSGALLSECGQRVGRVDREAVPPAPLQLELQRVELALPRFCVMFMKVFTYERIEGQPRELVRIVVEVVVELDRARRHGVEVLVTSSFRIVEPM